MDGNNFEIEKNSFNYVNNPQNVEQHINNNNVEMNNQNEYTGIGRNVIHPNRPGVDGYKVFIRQDGFPDFGNFVYFDDKVEFDPNKYRRPEIYFGFVHDQYIVPQILGLKNKNKKEVEEKKEEKVEEKKTEEKKNVKVKKSKKETTVKNLDDIMKKFNLKYIEPPKVEKVLEPPPEEENVEEEENPKDKNKKGKDAKDAKGKNVKDDKTDKNKAAANKGNKK